MTYFKIKFKNPQSKLKLSNDNTTTFKTRYVKGINEKEFETALHEKLWKREMNINDLLGKFNENVTSVLNNFAPEIAIHKRVGCEWYDNEIKYLEKLRDLAYKSYNYMYGC